MSLSKELGFPTHSVMPCPLVVPLQSNLTVILPTNSQKTKKHNPYPVDQPTLQSMWLNLTLANMSVRGRSRDYEFYAKASQAHRARKRWRQISFSRETQG